MMDNLMIVKQKKLILRHIVLIWLLMSSSLFIYSHEVYGQHLYGHEVNGQHLKMIKLDPKTTCQIIIRVNLDEEKEKNIMTCGFCDEPPVCDVCYDPPSCKHCNNSLMGSYRLYGHSEICEPISKIYFLKVKECVTEASDDMPDNRCYNKTYDVSLISKRSGKYHLVNKKVLQYQDIFYENVSNTTEEKFMYALNFDSMTLIRVPIGPDNSLITEKEFLQWAMKNHWPNATEGISCAFRSYRLPVDTVTDDDDDDEIRFNSERVRFNNIIDTVANTRTKKCMCRCKKECEYVSVKVIEVD